MSKHGLVVLSGLTLLIANGVARTDEPNNGGVEVLARGPVHEAFAEPLDPKPSGGPVVPKQPPQPIDELPPDQKPAGENVVWLPGYWAWDEDRTDFVWVSGFWRAPPPGRVWMPGNWRAADNGFQWTGGFWGNANEAKAEIQYLPEPPASLDAGPATPAPSQTAVYVPGCWIYRDARYLWRPGYWADFTAGWIWIPAHYRWTPCGYVFIDGYWDYPLDNRGMLFAPVYIAPANYAVAYTYTPTIVVQHNCMYGALFVRSGRGCYYFGDYFGPTYASAGYVSWVGYSGGGTSVVAVRGWYDPMYSYYRVSYRDDPYWRSGITELYVGRYRGDIAPPPRTLVQQTTVINNTVVNNTTVNNTNVINNNKTLNVNNVQMLTPISQVAKTNPNIKMQALSSDARVQQAQAAKAIAVVGQQRGQTEKQFLAQSPGPLRANDPPRSAKIDISNTSFKATQTQVHATTNTGAHTTPTTGQAARHDPIVPNRSGQSVTNNNTVNAKTTVPMSGTVGSQIHPADPHANLVHPMQKTGASGVPQQAPAPHAPPPPPPPKKQHEKN